jgi:hypothetical protein
MKMINADVIRMIISYYVIIAYLLLYVLHFHCQNRVLIGKREKKEKTSQFGRFLIREIDWKCEKSQKWIKKYKKCFENDRPNCDAFSEKTAKL